MRNVPAVNNGIGLNFMGHIFINIEFNISEQKHQIGKKVLRQDKNFCTILPYAKKVREIFFYDEYKV